MSFQQHIIHSMSLLKQLFLGKITSGNNIHTYVYVHVDEGNYYPATLIETINKAFEDNGLSVRISFDLDYNNPGSMGTEMVMSIFVVGKTILQV